MTTAVGKRCASCSESFSISPDDELFYGQMKVSAPRLCPRCRLQRRLAVRNERTLYKRTCDLCKANIVSLYPHDAKFPVYCRSCWWSDRWEPMSFGRPYVPGKSFFAQFRELSDSIPHLGIPNTADNVDSDYCSWLDGSKNCYLLFGSSSCENVLYSELLNICRDSLDLTNCYETEGSYQCVNSKQCFGSVWCINCTQCTNCSFCFDCKNSTNCFLSTNLRNKDHYFLNKPLSREEWQKKVSETLGSRVKMQKALERFKQLIREEALHRFANFIQTTDSTGNDLTQTKNAKQCFDSAKLEDCKFVTYGDQLKDVRDAYAVVAGSERCYEVLSTYKGSNSAFLVGCWEGNVSVNLSHYVVGAKDSIGCNSVNKKQYCILNKIYSKEEYNALKEQIVSDMVKNNEFGEYFPIAGSDFAYNETIANDYYPLTKEEALAKGYKWRDNIGGTFGKETMDQFDIPDNIADVTPAICNEILSCSTCSKNYRIIQREFDFYKKMKLPIPSQCTDCRYRERLKFRNPRELWTRTCMCAGKTAEGNRWKNSADHFHTNEHCPLNFETTYSPKRPEIVYDEKCYQAEIV